MAAEVVNYFFPKLIDLHNYIPANSSQQKFSNWNLLNRQDTGHLLFVYSNCMSNEELHEDEPQFESFKCFQSDFVYVHISPEYTNTH